MKIHRWISLALAFVFLVSCGGEPNGGSTPSRLPTAAVTTIPAPDTEAALQTFLEALKSEDFATMYQQISKASQAAINEADFTQHYTDALNKMGVQEVEYSILSALTHPTTAQVAIFADLQNGPLWQPPAGYEHRPCCSKMEPGGCNGTTA